MVPEVGISGGYTQYLGDINISNLFASPSPGGGIRFIYNLNQRMGINTGISYLTIKGDGELKYDNNFYYEFKNQYINYQVGFFVNFLEYDFSLKNKNFSPYMQFGIGFSKLISSYGTRRLADDNDPSNSHVVLPFGLGMKYLYKNRISFGLEYTFNHTFTDNLDGKQIVNPGKIQT